jgi:hypothetical protein
MDDYNFFIRIFHSYIPGTSVDKSYLHTSYYDCFCSPHHLFKGIVNDTVFSRTFRAFLIVNYIESYNVYKVFINKVRRERRKNAIIANTIDFIFKDFTDEDDDVIEVYQDKYLYKFRLNELNKNWSHSLMCDEFFFPCPKRLANPYTNIFFTKPILYKIFFNLVNSRQVVHPLITLYYECKFNLLAFKESYDGLIQDYIIYNYAYKSLDEEFYKYEFEGFVNYMNGYIKMPRYLLNCDFEASGWINRLIVPVRKFLHYYLIIKYSQIKFRKDIYVPKLISEFKEFIRDNYTYGRVTLRARRRLPNFLVGRRTSHTISRSPVSTTATADSSNNTIGDYFVTYQEDYDETLFDTDEDGTLLQQAMQDTGQDEDTDIDQTEDEEDEDENEDDQDINHDQSHPLQPYLEDVITNTNNEIMNNTYDMADDVDDVDERSEGDYDGSGSGGISGGNGIQENTHEEDTQEEIIHPIQENIRYLIDSSGNSIITTANYFNYLINHLGSPISTESSLDNSEEN